MTNKTILVIDDDFSTQRIIKHVLGSDFYLVTARTGEEGLTYVQKLRPSIILLDISLLGAMDGMEVLRRLKEHEEFAIRSIPVIMMTDADYIAASTCIRAGAINYFIKPFIPYKLSAVVKDVLEHEV